MKHIATLLFLSIALTMPAYEASDNATSDVDQSQGAQNERARKEFKRIDGELTKVFEQSLTELEKTPALREALISAQKAWLTFREADAHFESVMGEGGSSRSYYVNSRMTFLTKQRIYQLKTPFAQGWVEKT